MRNIVFFAVLEVGLLLTSCAGSSISPVELVCEYADDAVIDILNPRLSWINYNVNETNGAAQTAYQIRVASDHADFSSPVWDTGKGISDESAFLYRKVSR